MNRSQYQFVKIQGRNLKKFVPQCVCLCVSVWGGLNYEKPLVHSIVKIPPQAFHLKGIFQKNGVCILDSGRNASKMFCSTHGSNKGPSLESGALPLSQSCHEALQPVVFLVIMVQHPRIAHNLAYGWGYLHITLGSPLVSWHPVLDNPQTIVLLGNRHHFTLTTYPPATPV